MSVQPTPSRTVGDYTLLAKLGEGGMGVVHLARRPNGERVALKVLRPHIVGDDEARERLAREVGSLSRVTSRWVAEIVDADPWGPTPYVATRYVPGLSLHDHVPEEGPIAGADLRWFGRCLAEGIASVHAVGVLHRDVKPSNVLLEGRAPILIDFGLARVADDPKLTHTGWLLGTPGYLAPEILYGDDATTASDVHSWAATTAYAGLGHPPFGRGPSMAIMDRVRRGEHDLRGLPDDVRRVVAAGLDPDPGRRPRLDEIRELLADAPAVGLAPLAKPVLPADDPFTLPLAIAAHDAAAAETWLPPATPGSTRRFGDHDSADADDHHDHFFPFDREPRDDRLQPVTHVEPVDLETVAPRESPLTLARRAVLLATTALVVAAAVAGWPFLALAVVLVVSWLLRTCAMIGAATGDRRRLRGARWYDVVVAPLSAPWYLVAAVPGTVLLGLWSAGLATAGGLICYAFGTSTSTMLFVSGLVLAAATWFGPGSSHVRWPVRVISHPVARRTAPWALVVLLLLGGTGFATYRAEAGPSWTPFGDPAGWVR